MAYKPYKPRKEKDIYARYDGKNTKANNYDNGSVKLFGFRSGAVYKMVPAIFYIGTGIYGELSYYKFEPMDYVITVLKYIFFIVWFFSPAIFLSNFKYRDSLPLFKKHDAGSSIIGIITFIMCIIAFFICRYIKGISYISKYADFFGGGALIFFALKMLFF